MRTFVLLFFAVSLTACITVLPVPSNMNPSTTLGENVLNVSAGLAHEPLITLKESKDRVFGYLQPPINAVHFKVGYGITDRIDTELLFSKSLLNNISLILGLNYQWLGAPIYETKQGDLNSTVRFNLIGQYHFSDGGKGFSREQTAMGLGFSLSNSLGYMVSDWFSVYGGGRAIYVWANYETVDREQGSNSKTTDNHLWYFGPFVGVRLNTTGSIWKVVFAAEGNFTNIPLAAGFYEENERHWMPGYSSSLSLLYRF